MGDVDGMDRVDVNVDALKSEIRRAIINQKANACPIAMRMAWHAAGTYDANSKTGGTNGGTMRFSPESTDPSNAGLSIIRDLLHPVKMNHPEISNADLWAIAGCAGIEFLGGPKIPFKFGRTDYQDGARCPENGRLPDASKGADHLRQVFGRMGFGDKEIVALSGGHTLGRCHQVRSGFDGPWSHNPLRFDNSYYKNLLELDWQPRKWDGNFQFEDVQTGKLMMLPTDMALRTDPKFRAIAEVYAKDQDAFFRDFSESYAKLMCLGAPARCNPFLPEAERSDKDKASAEFRELAMHGSVLPCKRLKEQGLADVHQLEATSARSALHKAAFWGHNDMVRFLVHECKLNINAQDNYGDTPLHDAAKFGHETTGAILVEAGANVALKNKAGFDARAVALEHGHGRLVALIDNRLKKGRSKL